MSTAVRPAVSKPPRRMRGPDRVTFADFVRREPSQTKEDLVNGFVVPAMPAGLAHERLFAYLFFLMRGFASAKGLGEVLGSRTLVRIDERNAFEPDLLFVSEARRPLLTERALLGAPDVAVEIVSKSSRVQDRDAKFAGYERAGVLEYWLLDPERREAAFYRRTPEGLFEEVPPAPDGVFASTAFPGFRVSVPALFADPMPSEVEALMALLA